MQRHKESLSPARFAAAVGSDTKWVYNTAAVLKRRIRYTVAEARHLGLARELNSAFDIPLKVADVLAGRALKGDGRVGREAFVSDNEGGSAQLRIDVERYLSTFIVRLSRVRTIGAEKRRGRRPKPAAHPIAAARKYGVDIELLMSSLALTPAERLRRLDQNAAFLAAMRRAEPADALP